MRKGRISLQVFVTLCLAGCISQTGGVKEIKPEIVAVYPHDSASFTQGLVYQNKVLYESTGLFGESRLLKVDIDSGQALQEISLQPREFAEGLAALDNLFVQLTWHNAIAYVYDQTTLETVGQFRFDGAGWGLCFDGQRLVMSNGSHKLFFRNPDTFEIIGSISVTRNGEAQARLNELECANNKIYANVYLTDTIVEIDPETGSVDRQYDLSGLLTQEERINSGVLNGIAYNPDNGLFYITGKHWPKLYLMNFASHK